MRAPPARGAFSRLHLRNAGKVCIINIGSAAGHKVVPIPDCPCGILPLSFSFACFRVPDVPRRAPVVGLVGGIGSGKSHLARQLLGKHRIEIVEGDSAGHLVLEDLPVQEELRRIFGNEIFTADGKVDRPRLGKLVFGATPRHQAARTNLERIVHPRITEILKNQLDRARSRPDLDAVILDAALILEAGWRHLCDVVVFVDTSYEERLARVSRQRGWDRDELNAREASQLPLDQKRKEAQYVVDNSGDGRSALSQLESIFSRIVSSDHS